MIQTLLALWPIIQKVLKGTGIIKDPEEEKAFQIKMIEMAQNEERFFAQQIQSVNATMQAEARSEHWAQWLWRPIVGFTFAAVVINNYILMPYLQTYLHPIAIPSEVWNAMLMVLGVSAATRGWQKIEQERRKNGGANGGGSANGLNGYVPAPSVAPVPVPTTPYIPARPNLGQSTRPSKLGYITPRLEEELERIEPGGMER